MGVRPKRIFEYRGGSGVQKWLFWGCVLYGWSLCLVHLVAELVFVVSLALLEFKLKNLGAFQVKMLKNG